MCTYPDYNSLSMLDDYRNTVKKELQMWHDYYLPVHGTVVDAGAGCGETAFFYLSHGAEHVVCIEPNPDAFACLKQNFGNDPRVTILPIKVGHLKVDIEGGEVGMVVETHFPVRWKRVFDIPGSRYNVAVWRLERKRLYWRNVVRKYLLYRFGAKP